MRICVVCHNYPPAARVGGIEVFTQTLARGLVKRGHHVVAIGYSQGYDISTVEDDQGVYVLRIPPLEKKVLGGALLVRLRLEKAIRQVVREQHIDLVECPDVGGGLMIGHLGAPLIVRMHGAGNLVHRPSTGRNSSRVGTLFEKRTLNLADHLIAVSRYIRDATLKSAGIENRMCEVIYNGVDTNKFKPEPHCPRDSGRILFVGRLSETKGAPNLFRALPSVFRQFPETYLRFIGKDPIDSSGQVASNRLLSSIPRELRSRIELVGELSHEQIPTEFQSAGLAVFPSRAEAHPVSVLEAMACATPVVFMSHGPGTEMIDHGVDGLLCDTQSPASIAEAIITLLSEPKQAQQIGHNAAKRVKSKLSLPAFLDHNEQFYAQCIRRSES